MRLNIPIKCPVLHSFRNDRSEPCGLSHPIPILASSWALFSSYYKFQKQMEIVARETIFFLERYT
jgi:hypothetical protein